MREARGWNLGERVEWQALTASVCFSGFAVGFVALHAVRADLNPAQHFGSEYALGPHGWIMALNFLLMGVGLIALGWGWLTVNPQRKGSARVGVAFLFLAGAAFFVDIFFQTDPLGAPATTAGNIHSAFGLLVFLSIPAAALCLSLALWPEERWRRSRLALGALAVACLAAFFAFPPLAAMGLAGLGQRVALAVYIPWLLVCALQMHGASPPAPSIAPPAASGPT